MIATGEYTIVSLYDGNGIAETIVEYCLGLSGETPPGLPLTDEHGDVLMSNNGEILTDGDWAETLPTPSPGEYLWTRTRFMLTDGTFDMIYNVSLYGESGDDGVSITTEKEQYYLSTANDSLSGGEWVYAQPLSIPSGRYLFRRWEFTMSDGTKQYSNAIYNSIMEGVINLTDELDQKITQKIWSTDIDTSISAYDNSTVSTIRSQLSQHEQTMDSISDTIQDFQSSVDGDLTTMSNRITTSEQTLDGFMQTVTDQQSTMSGDISTLQSATSSLTQTADDFRFFVQRVADGQASTSTLNITSDGATFIGSNVSDKISIKNPSNTTTVISGGKISTDLVKSNNYSYSSGTYATAGTFLNLTDGSITSKNFAINSSGNAYFKGEVTASSGTIGGWKVTSDAFSKTVTIDSTEYRPIIYAPASPTTNNVAFGVGTRAAGSSDSYTYPFIVRYNGAVTATNITATGGAIGGFALDSTSIHTSGVAVTSNASNSLALSSSTFTRTINGTSRASLKLAIGSNFGVSNTGVLYAGGAVISGSITASSGKIGGYTISSTSNTGTTSNGGHAYTTSFYGHSGDGTYEYEVGMKSDATSTSGSGNLAFYVKKITAGAAWSTAENVFYVTHAGMLMAKNANITGTITSENGTIGGWTITSASLKSRADNKTTGMQKQGSGVWAIAVGATDDSKWITAPFRVNHDGAMYASSGQIAGYTINSTSLSYGSLLPNGNGGIALGTNDIQIVHKGGDFTFYSQMNGNTITFKHTTSGATDRSWACTGKIDYGLYSFMIQPDITDARKIYISASGGATLSVYGDISATLGGDFGGLVHAKVYSGGTGNLVGSSATDGGRVSHFGCNATVLAVSAQWGTTGSSYSTKNVTMNSSDIRIKDNILDTKECGVGFIDQIRLAEFDWKDGSGHKSIGIIADELEKLNPELVVGGGYDEDGCMNVKSIDTLELLSYAIKAIQELSDEIKQLKGEKG